MKLKAVIMRPDRRNEIVKLREKDIDGKRFKVGQYLYVVDSDRFMLTWDRRLIFWKKWYTTLYYAQGIARPLPVPDFRAIAPLAGENGDGQGHDWGRLVDNGIPAEDLAGIFNPWFFRIIAQNKLSKTMELLFYVALATAAACAFILFLLLTGNYQPPKV